MVPTILLEAHPTRILRDAWCPACRLFVATEVDVSLVNPETLAVIARLQGISCGCGFEDHTRL